MTTEKHTPDELAAEALRLLDEFSDLAEQEGRDYIAKDCSDNWRPETFIPYRALRAAINQLAALAAAQQVEPPGWKLVPVEPTLEMVAALATDKFPDDWEAGKSLQRKQMSLPEDQCIPFNHEVECAVGKYQRLLTAAPPAPAAEKRRGLTRQQLREAFYRHTGCTLGGDIELAEHVCTVVEREHGIPPADAKEDGK